MSGAVYRLFTGVLLGATMYITVYGRLERETMEESMPDKPRYIPMMNNMFLLSIFLLMPLKALINNYNAAETFHLLFSTWFSVFSHLCLFYALLSLALPLLRRYVSAKVCATLWLLPNYLYFLIFYDWGTPRKPLLVLNLPVWLVQGILWIWLAGFVALFGWKIVSHFRFRHQILQNAIRVTPESHPALAALWELEQQKAGLVKRRYALKISPAARTPMTFGATAKTICVILPDRAYTEEELSLILQHELIHMGRADCGTKVFLHFCTALCWINPLMWHAMRRSSEDLELSCDETVLWNADDPTRHRYADLILTTAGDDRGFTSCLSNSAKALRYRLSQVMHPRNRAVGAGLAGVIFFLLFLSFGLIGVTYAHTTGGEEIFLSQPYEEYSVTSWEDNVHTQYRITDPEAWNSYLSSLRLNRVSGTYTEETDDDYALRATFDLEGSGGYTFVRFWEDRIMVCQLVRHRAETYYYTLDDPLDLDYMRSLLVTQ